MDRNEPEEYQKFVGMDEEKRERLGYQERQAFDKWKDRRTVLLQQRMQAELAARMEELCEEPHFSRRFIQLRVRCPSDSPNIGVSLTIWGPTDDQVEGIKIRSILRVKNASIRQGYFNNMKQLSVNSAEDVLVKDRDASSFCCTTIYRLSRQRASIPRPAFVNVMGVLLHVMNSDAVGWSVSLTDESGRLMLVRSESTNPPPGNGFETYGLVLFNDVSIAETPNKPYSVEVTFSEWSSIQTRPAGLRANQLSNWAASPMGEKYLRQQYSSFQLRSSRLPVNDQVIVGFVRDLKITSSDLIILRIDCGDAVLKSFKCPLAFLARTAAECFGKHYKCFTNKSTDLYLASLRTLGPILQLRNVLLSFHVRHSNVAGVQDEITHISRLNSNALSILYSSIYKRDIKI